MHHHRRHVFNIGRVVVDGGGGGEPRQYMNLNTRTGAKDKQYAGTRTTCLSYHRYRGFHIYIMRRVLINLFPCTSQAVSICYNYVNMTRCFELELLMKYQSLRKTHFVFIYVFFQDCRFTFWISVFYHERIYTCYLRKGRK